MLNSHLTQQQATQYIHYLKEMLINDEMDYSYLESELGFNEVVLHDYIKKHTSNDYIKTVTITTLEFLSAQIEQYILSDETIDILLTEYRSLLINTLIYIEKRLL